MRVGESRSRFGEGIDVRSLHIGMPSEIANPIVLIVDRDHKDVGLLRRGGKRSEKRENSEEMQET